MSDLVIMPRKNMREEERLLRELAHHPDIRNMAVLIQKENGGFETYHVLDGRDGLSVWDLLQIAHLQYLSKKMEEHGAPEPKKRG